MLSLFHFSILCTRLVEKSTPSVENISKEKVMPVVEHNCNKALICPGTSHIQIQHLPDWIWHQF